MSIPWFSTLYRKKENSPSFSCVWKLAKAQVPKFIFLLSLRLFSECTFILTDWICLAAIADWNSALKDYYHELRQFSVVEIHHINQVWYSYGSTDAPTQLAAVGTQKAAEFVPKSAIVWWKNEHILTFKWTDYWKMFSNTEFQDI